MKFIINKSSIDCKARAGIIETDNGKIETPVFIPVGTLGNVKGVLFSQLEHDIKAKIILGNTYHLFLRPGMDVLKKAGGLHKFTGWNKPLLADSGGFQIFSLSKIRKIKEDGVEFRSHIDGSKHFFTPENVVAHQRIIGNDIIMPLDECTPYPCDYIYAKNSIDLTHRWLLRALSHLKNTESEYSHSQVLFAIVQGSTYKALRKESAKFISEQDVEGIAIGGLSVGEPAEIMYEMTDEATNILPEKKPRYLMGVGTPANLLECIALGIDMFDCVIPTRNGRNGMIFTCDGIINIKNKKWENDFSPIDEKETSDVDKNYSKAFLRHCFVAGEMIGPIIASIHNLSFYVGLMTQARNKIIDGSFYQWKNKMAPILQQRL